MMYDAATESLARAELTQLQIERLQAMLRRVYRNVAFYRTRFDQLGIDVEQVRDLEALQQLPCTTRADLQAAYPYGMFGVPLRDIVRLHASSGTTGKPTVVGYTRNDLQHWSALVARQLVSVGVSEHDIVQIAFSYSLFTGGLGFHYGAELLGAAVVPASSGANAADQLAIMRDYKTTVLAGTPSYALTIATALEEQSLHPEELNLRVGVFGAEPWSEALRERIETKLGLRAYDTYGVSEIMGPGVAAECEQRCGMHINEDHFIAEIIDPLTEINRETGEEGELVFTTITKEGFPVIRYRTGDLAVLLDGDCDCGRTFVRMGRVEGRTDDLVMAQGIKFMPSQLREVLMRQRWIRPDTAIVLDRKDGSDTIEVQVAVSEEAPFFDEISRVSELRAEIVRTLRTEMGISVKLTFVESATLRQKVGTKGVSVTDHRQR